MGWKIGWEELTDEEVETALANGLDYQTVYKRITEYEYLVEDAITFPKNVRKYDYTKVDIEHAAVYGVCESTFINRLAVGKEKGEAITTEPKRKMNYSDKVNKMHEQGYSYREIGKLLNVSKSTVFNIIKKGAAINEKRIG